MYNHPNRKPVDQIPFGWSVISSLLSSPYYYTLLITLVFNVCYNSIGKGSFGEIFLASNDTKRAVTSANAKYVVKIEPHSSGPLFVEIHCLLNAGRATGMYLLGFNESFVSKVIFFLILKKNLHYHLECRNT